jgi:hypothetical protein
MNLSRRDINLFLTALMSFSPSAQAEDGTMLPSKAYPFQTLAGKINPNTRNESWQVFRDETHDRFKVACHITRLAPGRASHPPHRHINEEVVFIHEGTIELR